MLTLRYLIEAAALVAVFCFFRLLPIDVASQLGSWLARNIGPHMRAHKTAEQNLRMVFPEKSEDERKKILNGMWDNLGRTAAEMPRLSEQSMLKRLNLRGVENLPTPGKQVLFVSGHVGNWELSYPPAHQRGIPVSLVYRRANNPYVDKIITWLRAHQCTSLFPKGPAGAVKLVRALKGGQSIALLIDQKMNDGIPVPFFGREAMTAPAAAQFALRYNLPIMIARTIRKGGAHFDWEMEPLLYEKSGDETRDVLTIMTAINAKLESWIRECPEQWFWVHKRWPSSSP